MPRRAHVPATRVSGQKKAVDRVRRKYKTNLKTKKKFLPGEESYIEDMIVVLKLGGYPNTQVAQIVGVSRNQIAEILKRPNVVERLTTLRAKLPQAALELLEGYMVEAVQAIVDIMRASGDDKMVLAAASEILDRAGLPKASRQERHTVNEERTTFTDDGIVERLREATPEVQEQAAQLLENLEELLSAHADVAEGTDGAD